jgi:hypothetical protein
MSAIDSLVPTCSKLNRAAAHKSAVVYPLPS